MNMRDRSGALAACFVERRFRCPCGSPDAPFVSVAAATRELALERFRALVEGEGGRLIFCRPCGRPLSAFVLDEGGGGPGRS